MIREDDDHPYASSQAAALLRGAILRIQADGVSLRTLAKGLNYKQSTVLSHMANGRVPVPLDRVQDIAKALGIPEGSLMLAALKQRFPGFNWAALLPADRSAVDNALHFLTRIERAAGKQAADLNAEQVRIMMEVATTSEPARRWLTAPELAVMEMIRQFRPDVGYNGLGDSDLDLIAHVLSNDAC
ncbi:helix-turn-helix transcriptional regulator [Sphingomonadaceae bacterium G21617-S1]|nr:helix-turn-helix transcriptional regulator [Sphingomonadaceae bacterium G21617-S1]